MNNYLTVAETGELLRSGKECRRKVMDGPEMLTGREMANRVSDMYCADVDAALVEKWADDGGVIGIRCGSMRRYPAWQLELKVWNRVLDISRCLDMTGWALYNWMIAPNGGLDGKTPRQALEDGKAKRVLKVAEADGSA